MDAFKSRRYLSSYAFARLRFSLVNVILVVGHEKLNVEMQRTYGAHLTIVKIPKSGGVSRRSANIVSPHEIQSFMSGCGA